MKRKLNFDILESLRGLAALYVCIAHCRGVLWIGGEHYLKTHPRDTLGFTDYLLLGLNMLTRLSTEAVIIFFVLSGFSIAHSLRKNTEVLPFYKRRFIRLYPPYLVALFWAMLAVWVLRLFVPEFTDGSYNTPSFDRMSESLKLFDMGVFVKNLFYLPHSGGLLHPFWSLTMEVIFYLAAPYVLRNRKMYYSISIILFLVVLVATSSNWITESILSKFVFFNIFFVIGVALYHSYDSIVEKTKQLHGRLGLAVCALMFFSMIALSLAIVQYETYTAFIAAALSVLLIIYLLVNNLEIRWLIGIGRFSYTLYITHFPTIFLYMALYFGITNAEPPYITNPFVFIPCIFLCLGVAYIHYYFVEKRSKSILDNMRNNTPAEKKRWIFIPKLRFQKDV